jgi:hypothetical protein
VSDVGQLYEIFAGMLQGKDASEAAKDLEEFANNNRRAGIEEAAREVQLRILGVPSSEREDLVLSASLSAIRALLGKQGEPRPPWCCHVDDCGCSAMRPPEPTEVCGTCGGTHFTEDLKTCACVYGGTGRAGKAG